MFQTNIIAKQLSEIKLLKEAMSEQEKDNQILQDENRKLISKAQPGPIVWVGNIDMQLHEEEMKFHAEQKGKGYVDRYFWPKLWFNEIKDEIICKVSHTE